tara:strand:- start:35 stop:628 length:594 start_codon:yes stop_codon:yes gene_type:complete
MQKNANTFRKIRAGVPEIKDNGILNSFVDPSWESVVDGTYGLSIPYVESIRIGEIEADKEDGILYVDVTARVPFKVSPWWKQNPESFFSQVEKSWGTPLYENTGLPFERYFFSAASVDWGPSSVLKLYGSYEEPYILVEKFVNPGRYQREFNGLVQEMTAKFSKEYKLSASRKQAISQIASILKQMDAEAKKLFRKY